MTDWPNSNPGSTIKPSTERGSLAAQNLTPKQRRLMEIFSMEWTEVKEREDLDSYPFVQTVPIPEYQPQAISPIGSLLPNWKDITYHPVEKPVGGKQVSPAEAQQTTVVVETLGTALTGITGLFKQIRELPIFEAGMEIVENLMGTQERQETSQTQDQMEAEKKKAEYRWSREKQEHVLQEVQTVERRQQMEDVRRVEGDEAAGMTDEQKNELEGLNTSLQREYTPHRATGLRAALIERHKAMLNQKKEFSITETTRKPIVNLNNQEGGNAGGQMNITSTGGGGVG